MYYQYRLSGSNLLDRSVKYFSGALSIIWDPQLIGILVCFDCTWRNILVCSGSFYAYNFPTGNTAHVSTYFSDSFPRMCASSESIPYSFLNSKKFSIPNLASSQGQIIPGILHFGFYTCPYYSTAIHHLKLSPGALNTSNPFSETPSLDMAFRCSKSPLLGHVMR